MCVISCYLYLLIYVQGVCLHMQIDIHNSLWMIGWNICKYTYTCLRGLVDRVSEICMRLYGFEARMSHIYKFINFTGGDGVVGDK